MRTNPACHILSLQQKRNYLVSLAASWLPIRPSWRIVSRTKRRCRIFIALLFLAVPLIIDAFISMYLYPEIQSSGKRRKTQMSFRLMKRL